jgi:hypothetical protein
MGKVTDLGSLPPDHTIYSGGPEAFSHRAFRPSSKSTAPSTDGETQAAPRSSTSPNSAAANADETEEDGIRAEALRREKVRRLSPAYRKSKEQRGQTRG